MSKRMCALIVCVVLAASPGILAAQTASPGGTPAGSTLTPWSFLLSPQVHIPLTDTESLFSLAYGGTVGANFAFRGAAGLNAELNLGYDYGTLGFKDSSAPSSLSEATIKLDAAYNLSLANWLSLRAFVGGGLLVGWMNGTNNGATFYPGAEGGLGINLLLDPQLTLRIDASYLYKFGLYGALNVGTSLIWTIPEAKAANGPSSQLRLLDFTEVKLGSVFPIMQTYYDDHAIGTVRITNSGKETASNLKIAFQVRQFMDGPKTCALISSLAPGESREVPLFALFNSRILEVTEATKATGELSVEYTAGAAATTQTTTVSLRVYDRNAMTWDDDQKAAAFVSGKDPWVLDLSNNINAAVKDLRTEGIAQNMQTAIAFHAGLRQYGLSYVTNPKNPFAQTFANPETVDFLKFPRQTLAYKSGDCSDLSILYASFFESVGIETAFITVPGHIFMAYSLDMSPESAKSAFSTVDDLIIQNGKAWMPLEVTMRDSSLVDIWREGAREWRQGQSAKTAAFYPIHAAWKTYAPVGLAADNTSADPIAKNRIALLFESEANQQIAAELDRRIIACNSAIKAAPNAKNFNARGVLYARYGKLTEAEKDFQSALKSGDYAPALINLGNIAFLRLDNLTAYIDYQRAAKLAPDNVKLQVDLAKVSMALGKNDEALKALDHVKARDPALAEQYASVAMAANQGGVRADDKSNKPLLWVDE